MIRGIRPEALVLREDFCATAAIARLWAAEGRMRGDDARAMGVDLDQEALERGAGAAACENVAGLVKLIRADAIHAPVQPGDRADIVFVGNFSIGFITTQAELLTYFRLSRGRLGERGALICEINGGPGAMRVGAIERTHIGPGAERIEYRWECEEVDPVTRMVTQAMSFRVVREGVVLADLPRAFVYRWRMWSEEELRELMLQAGFRSIDLYQITGDWPRENPIPVTDPAELGDDWVAMIAARV
jgi:ubiquinone/menaquinone biosynthesis C-methylase UbiE